MTQRESELDTTIEAGAVGRLDRLANAASRIRGGRRVDPERLQLIVGALLAVIGVVAIFLGWYAAARTPYLFEQIPYLISGGLLGVALAVLGGLVYFAYWVTRLVRESRAQSERAWELLDRIAETLDGAAASNGGRTGRTRSSSPDGAFVATRTGTLFHRPDCSVVAGKRQLRRVTPQTRGLKPCAICDPLS